MNSDLSFNTEAQEYPNNLGYRNQKPQGVGLACAKYPRLLNFWRP